MITVLRELYEAGLELSAAIGSDDDFRRWELAMDAARHELSSLGLDRGDPGIHYVTVQIDRAVWDALAPHRMVGWG